MSEKPFRHRFCGEHSHTTRHDRGTLAVTSRRIRHSAGAALSWVVSSVLSAPHVATGVQCACHLLASRHLSVKLQSDDIRIDHTVAPVRPCPPIGALHPLGPLVCGVALSDVGQGRDRYDAQTPSVRYAIDQCRPDDARGLEVSRGSLIQDQLVQRQVRNVSSEPLILLLKTFEFPQLSRPHATILLAPSIKRLLRNLDFPDRINPRHPLTNEHLNLAKLRHDLFRIVSLGSRSLVLLY